MLLFLLAAGFSFSAFAAAPAFQSGIWETTYKMEASGMPFAMPAINFTKSACLNASNYVPDVSQPGQECVVNPGIVSANMVTWTIQCKTQGGSIEGQGKANFHDDRLDGAIDAKLISPANPGLAVSYRYTFDGKRIGTCSK